MKRTYTSLANNFHPSLLMAAYLFTLAVVIVYTGESPVLAWFSAGIHELTGGLVSVRSGVWVWVLGVCSLTIGWFRPPPYHTFLLSAPGGFFIILQFVYGIVHPDRYPGSVFITILMGFLALTIVQTTSIWAANTEQEKRRLQSELDRLKAKFEEKPTNESATAG